MAEALCADSAVTLHTSPFSVGNTSGASHFHTCHLGSSHMPQISSLPERGCVLQLAHIPNGNDLPNPYQAYNQENRGCVDSSEVKNPPPLKRTQVQFPVTTWCLTTICIFQGTRPPLLTSSGNTSVDGAYTLMRVKHTNT